MSALRLPSSRFALALLASSAVCLVTIPAHADEYSDLLDILRAKGSLTKGEYNGLMAKHRHHLARDASSDSGPSHHAASHHTHSRNPAIHTVSEEETSDETAAMRAQDAASRAEASAEAARQALLSTRNAMNDPMIVHTTPYVPGKGVTFKAGPIDINLSGFVNGFYTFNSPNGGAPVSGGLSTGTSGFDTSAVRNGLLPAALLVKLSTTQDGLDLSANFGFYPGIDNNKPGALNANSGGSSVALGTAGLDVRQAFVTVGNKDIGTFTIGRQLALFGADAILNDATLLSVGSTGSNSAPANTALGRIGFGYVYADWIPQISYATPKWKGLQGTIGIFQPLDEFNFAGGGESATNTQHSSPMIQGKVSYDFTAGDWTGHLWSSFLIQHQQALTGTNISSTVTKGATVAAADIGGKIGWGPLEGVAYYYYGNGLGTTGLFFDGIADNGRKRNSEGYYVQLAYKILPKLKLVGSYGQSNLYRAPGENNSLLVRRNESEIGALYYNMTDWLTLMGEYAHSRSAAHNANSNSDNTMSLGAAIFF